MHCFEPKLTTFVTSPEYISVLFAEEFNAAEKNRYTFSLYIL